jgi:Retroviral aspartyl protease
MLLGESEAIAEEEKTEPVQDETVNPPLEEAFVSMHATSYNQRPNTMKFEGQLGNTPIYALIDSRSTHNFINLVALQGQMCQIQDINPMMVMVANGEKMITDFKCASLLFFIQGYEFKHELRLLQGYEFKHELRFLSVRRYDMISELRLVIPIWSHDSTGKING